MSPEGSRAYFTTNPESPYHWLKTDVIDGKDYTHGLGQDVWWQQWLLSDNPNLGEKYIGFLDRSYAGVWHARYIKGLWVLAEGSIYSGVLTPDIWYQDGDQPADLFSRNGHVSHVVSIDAGTINSQVYGDYWDDGKTIWMPHEYYWDSQREHKQLTNQQYVEHLINGDGKNWPGFPKDQREWPSVICDPSAASFKVEMANRGVMVRDAKNEVKEGIRRVTSAFGNKILRIHERCTGTRGDLEAYAWDEKAAARGEEKPLKIHDHGADQVRYKIETDVNDWRLAA
jgi:hypothetical protein